MRDDFQNIYNKQICQPSVQKTLLDSNTEKK